MFPPANPFASLDLGLKPLHVELLDISSTLASLGFLSPLGALDSFGSQGTRLNLALVPSRLTLAHDSLFLLRFRRKAKVAAATSSSSPTTTPVVHLLRRTSSAS